MPITETEGKKFIQLNFTATSGDAWAMSRDMLVRSVRLTAPPGYLADTDYITFAEDNNSDPNIFTLSAEAKATFCHGVQATKLAISDYALTYPTSVVVSIEVD